MDFKEKEQSLKLAEHYFRDNNYSFAKHILGKVIEIDANNSKANELLAYIYTNTGEIDIGFRLLTVACNENDCSPEALYFLGSMQLKRGLFSQAINTLKKSILKGGEFFEGLHDLASAQANIGEFSSSFANYQKCLFFGQASHELFFNIARTLDELKRYEEAITHYDKALSLKPDYAEVWSNKGLTLHELKRYEEAITHYDKALSLKPNYAEAWSNKGNTLYELKHFYEAIAHYDKALSLNPNYYVAWSNRGAILNALKRYDEAIAHYDKAISLKPDYHKAWANKGNTLSELKRYQEAITHYDKALTLKPDIDWVSGELRYTKMKICSWSDLVDSFEDISKKVMAAEKVSAPFPLLSMSDDALLHKKSSEIYIQSKYPLNFDLGPISKYPKKEKIRIAYFSPDFRNHPVSLLTSELFELHDKDRFEIFAFSLQKAPDSDLIYQRLRQSFDKLIDVERLSDIQVAQLTREYEIDIAIDLAGHTTHSRTGIFACRAAPIQVNWLGYPGTIGANFIDYIVADQTIIPDIHHKFYTEKVARLPNTYMVDDSKRIASSRIFTRTECRLPEKGFVFCCFNNDYKFNPKVFDSWSRILLKVEHSVLWISENQNFFKENLKIEFEKRGIISSRIIFARRLDLNEDHLARYALADLFLDTYPYNAHTTAVDSLKSGVPVLTRIGQSFASRVAASLLNAIGLPELITSTQEEYEALAIELATNPQKLADIKLRLAKNRFTAPLFDTPLFTKNLEAIYIKMMERYQAGLEPEHIAIT